MDPISALGAIILKNPILAGGAPLLAMGGLMAYLRQIPSRLTGLISYFFHYSISVESSTDVFAFMKDWVMEQEFSKKARHLSVSTIYIWNDIDEDNHDRSGKTKLVVTPENSWQFTWVSGHPIIFKFRKEAPKGGGGDGYGGSSSSKSPKPTETIIARAFTRSGLEAVKKIYTDIGDKLTAQFKDRVKVYSSGGASYGTGWSLRGLLDKRVPNTIVTDKNLLTEMIEDIKVFKASKPWYSEKGIPWRRGYILEGPPGNGKSSIILALASELDMNIYYLNPKDASDSKTLSSVPQDALLVVEEVDTLFQRRAEMMAKTKSKLSDISNETLSTEALEPTSKTLQKEMSTFINALDGLMAGEGRVLIMTTNRIDSLDPAMIRPGRADRTYHVGNATRFQLKGMFLKFFPDKEELAEDFSLVLPEGEISMARLQEFFMTYRESADVAFAKATELVPNAQTEEESHESFRNSRTALV